MAVFLCFYDLFFSFIVHYDCAIYAQYRTQWTAEGSVFGTVSLFSWFVLFVYEISREPLNGFAPNSHGRRVSSIAWTSLKVEVKGQGHYAQKNGIFRPFGNLRAVYVW